MSAKKKIIIIIFVYFIVLVIQLASFTPYKKEQTTYSAQNVPHTITIGRGYACISDIGVYSTKGKNYYATQIDYARAIPQFLIPAGAVIAVCIYIYLKNKASRSTDDLRTAELLIKIKDLEKEKQTLETILSDCLLLDAPPCKPKHPDFHTLAFADEQSQKKAIFEYEDKLSLYVRYKTLNEYISLVHGKRATKYDENAPLGTSFVVKTTGICDAEIDELVNTEPLSEEEQLQIFEEMSKTSKPKETFYLLEAADGALVRVPASKLDDWVAAQKKQRNE